MLETIWKLFGNCRS